MWRVRVITHFFCFIIIVLIIIVLITVTVRATAINSRVNQCLASDFFYFILKHVNVQQVFVAFE